MGIRGPQSAASLEVVRSKIDALDRPQPADELTADQRAEWIAIVNRLPADWFPRETHGMLVQYCRHVVTARRVGEMIESLIDGKTETQDFLSDYEKLLRMQEREGRAISALATRMRISQQSSYEPRKARGTKTPKQLPHQT